MKIARIVLRYLVAAVWGGLTGYGALSAYEYWTKIRPFDQCIEAKKPLCAVGDRKVYITYR